MSRIRANTITNLTIDGPPTVSTGLQVTGVTTSTSFAGALTGNVSGDVTGDVTGNVTGDLSGDMVGAAVTTDSQGVRVAGVVTATSFVGNGADLTGLTIPAGTDWRDSSLF